MTLLQQIHTLAKFGKAGDVTFDCFNILMKQYPEYWRKDGAK